MTELFNPHVAWEQQQIAIREVLLKERKSRLQSPILSLPGYSDIIGIDKRGKPVLPKLYGRYVRYSFDRNGYLSTGKRHGRRNPHPSPREVKIKNLCVETFRDEFNLFHEASVKKYGDSFLGVSPEEFMAIASVATVKAKREFYKRLRKERYVRNARSLSSRQINRGLILGQDNRIAHAEG
jgi:hypothetical protein